MKSRPCASQRSTLEKKKKKEKKDNKKQEHSFYCKNCSLYSFHGFFFFNCWKYFSAKCKAMTSRQRDGFVKKLFDTFDTICVNDVGFILLIVL